ncbi:YtpI family protein [Alkalicoccobacillus plakortidis]|uniref:YtpI family protein n=1 Tax=Alkalicoccobacillus plakortidis TaxID=444060 RepID=A0ABT0XH80_9BACI|nr:YtpI family protein [Alkalicoccobacillus plakortidis]MCM2675276.1 YtpI family protein [Alkalicoccobacillus plakortidis]
MDKLLIILIVFTAVFFLYNRIQAWRKPDSLIKKIYETRSRLFLGLFLLVFSLNLLVQPRGVIDMVIGSVLMIFALANTIYGFKAYKHYIAQAEPSKS